MIRAAVISESGIAVGAGGAVVVASDPTSEHDEMVTKAAPVLRAIQLVEESFQTIA